MDADDRFQTTCIVSAEHDLFVRRRIEFVAAEDSVQGGRHIRSHVAVRFLVTLRATNRLSPSILHGMPRSV